MCRQGPAGCMKSNMTATASSAAKPETRPRCSAEADSTGRCASRRSRRRSGTLPATIALIDGEIAFVLPSGITDFKSLQEHIDTPNPAIRYYVFDLLELDGKDWRGLPLKTRKERLQIVADRKARVRMVDLFRSCRWRWSGGLQRRVRGRARGHHLQAGGPDIPLRPRQGLAQDQMPSRRGIRDRRL